MTEETSRQNSMQSASRRKLLKGLGGAGGALFAGGALPEKWAKPIVQSVMLPVHAVATGQLLIVGGGGGGSGNASLLERTFELVVPKSLATYCPNNIAFGGCISFSFAHDGAGNVVGPVTLLQLAPQCFTPPTGPTYDSAHNVQMNGGPINYTRSVGSDGEGRIYLVQLTITNASAPDGQKFGRVALERSNPSSCSPPQSYLEFDVYVGVNCTPQYSECIK